MDEDYINMELISSPQTKSKEFEFQYFSIHIPADHLFFTTHQFVACSTAPCTPLVSPSQSCRASCELNPSELTTFFNNQPTSCNSWSKKLKMKHSLVAHKLKSSRAYLKSLFTKSACSDHISIGKKLATLIKKIPNDDHRRSFSSNSGLASFNSSGLQFSRRSSSAAEIEVSIDAAIAHCKKSMQSFGICSLPPPKYVQSN